jgi:hypothetical protein
MPPWLPDAPWYVLAGLAVVIFVAYTVFGATGFGSSILSVPALAHWFPLTFAVPLVTALDCAATINASTRQWRRADFGEFKRILPAMLLGVAVGTTLLVNLPRAPALLVLGVFVAGYGAYQLIGRREWRAVRPLWAWPVGFVGGLFSAAFVLLDHSCHVHHGIAGIEVHDLDALGIPPDDADTIDRKTDDHAVTGNHHELVVGDDFLECHD